MIGTTEEGLARYKEKVRLLQEFVLNKMRRYSNVAKTNQPLSMVSASWLLEPFQRDCAEFRERKMQLRSMEEVLGLTKDEVTAVYREIDFNENLQSLSQLDLTPR